jgi:hypothetical protein
MKLGCFCNMNNCFFSIVRYLRDKNIDAELCLLNNELPHFHPSVDTYDLSYQNYTKSLSWGNYLNFNKSTHKEIEESIKPYDFIIACGSVPAYLNAVGRTIDLFVPYGTDIFEYPFFKIVNPKYQMSYLRFSKFQKRGIRTSKSVTIDMTNNYFENIITKLQLLGKRYFFGIPMIYIPIYNPDKISYYYNRSQWYKEFEFIRNNNDIVVFHQTRHLWKNFSSVVSKGKKRIFDAIDYKANDTLIRGFASFVRKQKKKRSCLVMFEYGKDLLDSKKLVTELGIDQNVKWFPLTSRKEIMIGLSLSDFGSGEFGNSWLSCGTVYETLAMAKPLLHYREDLLYKNQYPELYPMINCQKPEHVTAALEDYCDNKQKYETIGEKGRQWFTTYAIEYPLQEYMKIFQG